MVATPQIGRKLTFKRRQKLFSQRTTQQTAHPLPVVPAPMSDAEFEAALDEMAEGSENRAAPLLEAYSREHIYADHD